MPAAKRLKVFRTATGFHDAYVAAPSKKAALEAWGASNDLFAIGAAEIVTDPALTAAPLAAPGEVIRKSRGSLAEQLAALPPSKANASPARKTEAEADAKPAKPARKPKPKPPPSRATLDELEAEQAALAEEAKAQLADIRAREEALRQERAELDKRHKAVATALAARLARENERYQAALARWREQA